MSLTHTIAVHVHGHNDRIDIEDKETAQEQETRQSTHSSVQLNIQSKQTNAHTKKQTRSIYILKQKAVVLN